MAKALSIDLRRRVVDAIEQGLSCRRAAEWFGVSASSIPAGGDRSVNAVWTYETPFEAMAQIKDYVAFYPDRVDEIN